MTDDLQAGWEQLLAIVRAGDERSHRRHEVVCAQCGDPVLYVWNTDPLVFRISQRHNFENYIASEQQKRVVLPDLAEVVAEREVTDQEVLAASASEFRRTVGENAEINGPQYLLNKRSKNWDRPRLCSELIDGAFEGGVLDLTCRCAQPLPVDIAQLVVDIETRRPKRAVKRTRTL